MTRDTSHDTPDATQKHRSTDSQSATKTPNQDRGVVQDGPGTHDLGFADNEDSGNGNLTEAETGRPDRDDLAGS